MQAMVLWINFLWVSVNHKMLEIWMDTGQTGVNGVFGMKDKMNFYRVKLQ